MNSTRPKRIVVIGCSCSGKTTLAKRIAKSYQIPHVELDALYWLPDWQPASQELLENRVETAISNESWIVDGNYPAVRDKIWSKANTIVWIDLPLLRILSRFFRRSIRRSLKHELLWNGCRENFKNNIFSKDSLLLWILKTHGKYKQEYTQLMQKPPYSELRCHRLRSNKDIEYFLNI